MAAAHSHSNGCCTSKGGLRLVLVMVVGVLLVCYIVGPPLYWSLRRSSSTGQASCLCVVCNCPSEFDISFPLGAGVTNGSFTDCGKNDPDLNEEMEKDIVSLLSEEITLQKMVANDSLEHTNELIMSARKSSSQYQREAEKCNTGIETCEAARERAEEELVVECRLAELWEKRAREQGWKEDDRRSYMHKH
ncbi:hypothetical protein Dsin_023770 [Dipteronia sinensis]|uniref:Uncharacterized protein n=1 Tax=Dipteronia sinensis TaxID=43782 RepID=A0AAE0A3Z6_9ROSI|nr:hypothetical protein Dsin_023770 [Dipteronia sinensis]